MSMIALGLGSSMALAQNCPNPEGGDCCTVSELPGCQDVACCTLVCEADIFCCENGWDETCVELAGELCDGCGGGGGGGGGSAENDGCAEATEVFLGNNPVSNFGATTNGPEDCDFFGNPQTWNDVWYVFNSVEAGALTISTCNSVDWDSKVVVYRDGCDTLSFVGCNDDGTDSSGVACTGFTSLLTIGVEADTEYIIRLGAYSEAEFGSGTMTLSMLEPCDTTCPKGSIDEVEPCGSDTNGGCNADPGGGAVETIALGDTICGTYWGDGTNQDTDWYEFTIEESMILTVAANTDVSLAATVSIVNALCNPTELVTATESCPSLGTTACVPAGVYRVIVTPGLGSTVSCGDAASVYNFTVTGEMCELPPAPENDLCADAIAITDGTYDFTTVDAQTDGPATPNCAGFGSVNAYNDVWYTYVASMTGICEVSTCDTVDYDSKMAAYVGDCTALQEVGCNDDGPNCANFTSLMTFACEEGVEYYIRIGGYEDGGFGSGTFSVAVNDSPKNDSCENPIEVVDGETDFSTVFASTDGAEDCDFFGNLNTYNDVWFRYTAICDAPLTVSTCNLVDYDSKIVLYEDDGSCPPTAVVGCNDDGEGCANLSSLLVADVVKGQSYLIRVGGYGDGGWGSGTLLVACDAADPCEGYTNDCQNPEVIPGPGDYSVSTVCAFQAGGRDVDLTGFCDPGAAGDDIVNNCYFMELTPSVSGEWSFSTCSQSTFDTNLALLTADCAPANVVACLDDTEGCDLFTTTLIADLVAGETYVLCVGGYDVGTYGTCTLTVVGGEEPPVECPGDLNGDGEVSGADITLLFGYWETPDGDLNGDGNTNGADLTVLLANWGDCPQGG